MMLEELQRRNYSAITTRKYLRVVTEFAKYFGKFPDRLGPNEALMGHPPISANVRNRFLVFVDLCLVNAYRRRKLEGTPVPASYFRVTRGKRKTIRQVGTHHALLAC
jgi:hypothetical protein